MRCAGRGVTLVLPMKLGAVYKEQNVDGVADRGHHRVAQLVEFVLSGGGEEGRG